MKAHIRKNLPSAVVWNLKDLAPVKQVCAELGLALLETAEQDLDRCLGEILGLPGRYQAGLHTPKGDFPAALILHGLADAQLDTLLARLREKEISIPLKAVVTDTNRQWPLGALLQELCEERAAFEAGR